ncbi:MAG: hypothetical protein AB1589_29655 [Cyanobacteriota bacterium]
MECLGRDDKTIILWDWKTGKILHTLSGHFGSVVAVTFSSNGEVLVSGSWDKMIKGAYTYKSKSIVCRASGFRKSSVSGQYLKMPCPKKEITKFRYVYVS